MKTHPIPTHGSTVIVVLTMSVALTILATSILQIMSATLMSGYRYVPFTQALFTAEAGADFAWSEVNKATKLIPGAGEPFSGTNWTKTVTGTGTVWTLTSNALTSLFAGNEGASLYNVTVYTPNTAAPYDGDYVIEATGIVNAAPKMGQSEVRRTVKLYLEPEVTPVVNLIGLFGKIGVINNGNAGTIMSYNSQNGLVLPGQTDDYRHWGDVGSLASFTNAVSAGNMNIYGSISTGPGGTVGTNNNFNMYSGSDRTNGISDNLTATIPDVHLPDDYSGSPILLNNSGTAGANGGTVDYKMASGQSISTLTVTGSGVVRIWAPSGIKMAGGSKITISPSTYIVTNSTSTVITTNSFKSKGKTYTEISTNNVVSGTTNYNDLRVEFYVEDEIKIAGNGLANANGRPQNAYFYGLTNCTSVDLGGTPKIVGVFYAPQADLKIRGTADFYGSAVANQITIQGNYFVGIDESLFGDDSGQEIPGRYVLTKWEEN
ncbi:DUF7305 domain-containing protein [Geitlerinema calcuttense]|uniref:DUF7305 domain-containing protein n=1 Tax=Geitlerinema calcuttense NRMC-F 0142 TaxID=2922238 RepID=A0ABT7M0P8_9CYAN|nr:MULTISPECIES: hypothetical protein [Cyanophyceae]MDL5055604.1 hypothetical protein [Oscillatoria laete-virens NRMC-F 0139]MDL5057829.1 hypothetical protein [Geitlerinema calcuttense NRMC-F 0142]